MRTRLEEFAGLRTLGKRELDSPLPPLVLGLRERGRESCPEASAVFGRRRAEVGVDDRGLLVVERIGGSSLPDLGLCPPLLLDRRTPPPCEDGFLLNSGDEEVAAADFGLRSLPLDFGRLSVDGAAVAGRGV